MNVAVEAVDVHKSYAIGRKTLPVLRGASLRAMEGEAIAVVGVSGAGKSTLLHLLGGLDHPDQGRVLMGGRDLSGLTRRQSTALRAAHVGFVFQSYHLLPEMDVLENVMLPAMALARGAGPAGGIRRRATALLEAMGLGERAGHTPLELSGGEQQRVAMARALMNEPRIVLADEPTGNLDDGTGGFVLERLFALVRGQGRTLVMVTHNRAVAATCDRMLVLTDGRLTEERANP